MINANNNFNQYSEKLKSYDLFRKDHEVFQRIVLTWKESDQLFHVYAPCINLETGELYLDDPRRLIFAKMAITLPLRAGLLATQTLYNASVILPMIAYAGGLNNPKKLRFFEYMKNSLEDVARTPFYAVAILTIQTLGLLFALICPNSLYKTREIIGKLERNLLRVGPEGILSHLGNLFLLTPCFSPMYSFPGPLILQGKKDKKPWEYSMIRSQVWHVRENRDFKHCFVLQKGNKPYISRGIPPELIKTLSKQPKSRLF